MRFQSRGLSRKTVHCSNSFEKVDQTFPERGSKVAKTLLQTYKISSHIITAKSNFHCSCYSASSCFSQKFSRLTYLLQIDSSLTKRRLPYFSYTTDLISEQPMLRKTRKCARERIPVQHAMKKQNKQYLKLNMLTCFLCFNLSYRLKVKEFNR